MKSDHFSAQVQHGSLEAETGSCARLIKKSRQLETFGRMRISGRIFLHIFGKVHELIQLFNGEVKR